MTERRRLQVGWRPGGLYRLSTARGVVRYRVVRADSWEPERRPALVVGLHGYGSDERQIASLIALDLDGPIVYLAPRAPVAVEGGGFGWFEVSAGSKGDPLIRPNDARLAILRVHAFADAAAEAWTVDPARSALVGYSQGGSLAVSAALVDPGSFVAIAAIAGHGIEEHLREAEQSGAGKTPLFVGHGTLDPAIPVATMDHATHRMRRAGLDLTHQQVAAPHVVTESQRQTLTSWLNPRLKV